MGGKIKEDLGLKMLFIYMCVCTCVCVCACVSLVADLLGFFFPPSFVVFEYAEGFTQPQAVVPANIRGLLQQLCRGSAQ